MTRIYPTFRNQHASTAVTIPELAVTGDASAARNASPRKRPLAAALTMLVASGFAIAPAWAQTEIYDESINRASASSLNLPEWLVPGDKWGLLHGSGSGTVSGATLIVNYTTAPTPEFAIGGYSASGSSLDNNTVIIRQGKVDGPVYGGLSHQTSITPDLTGSSSGINTGANTSGSWSSQYAEANNQIVIVEANNEVTGDVYGAAAVIWGKTGNAEAGGDTINSSLSTTAATRADSYVYDSIAQASSNTVSIFQGAKLNSNLYGSSVDIIVQTGDATSSSFTASSSGSGTNASARADAEAGVANVAVNANDNSATVYQDATVGGGVYGGKANLSLRAGTVHAGFASNTGSGFAMANAGTTANTAANNSAVHADNNLVIVYQDATVGGSVYGGMASFSMLAGTATSGVASALIATTTPNATVFVEASAVYADNNSVTVHQGTAVGGSVYGGMVSIIAHAGNATGGFTDANAFLYIGASNFFANGNTVNFNGTLQGDGLYGGYIELDIERGTAILSDGSTPGNMSVTFADDMVEAINNIVTIGESAQFSATSSLYGGYQAYDAGLTDFGPSYDLFTGNTLNYTARTPTQLQTLANFQYLNFTLNPALANTGTALITAQDVVLGANSDNASDASLTGTPSQVAVVGIHSGEVLSAGDTFLVVKAENTMTGDGDGSQDQVSQAQQGISLLYDVRTTVDVAQKEITAEILSCQTSTGDGCPTPPDPDPDPPATVNPQLKALAEGNLSGLMLVTRGADLIAHGAFAAMREQAHEQAFTPFIIAVGSHTRYNSGSHIDSDDFLLTAGLSCQRSNLVVGAFAEGGWGNYDSYNSFYNAASVHGDGHTRYYGAGVLGRYDFASGLYAEGSLRAGTIRTRFDTRDIVNLASGEYARYSLRSRYLSAHAGLGYLYALDPTTTLDISLKYLHSTVAGKDLIVAGDAIHFDRMNSHRVRLGAEFTWQYSPTLALQAGLGNEYEFDGKAEGTTYGRYAIDAPTMRGGTGLLMLGARVTPAGNQRLNLDVKASGYTGQRSGVGGSVQLSYTF